MTTCKDIELSATAIRERLAVLRREVQKVTGDEEYRYWAEGILESAITVLEQLL